MTEMESGLENLRYDAGPEVSPKEWLRLHRNENLFLDESQSLTALLASSLQSPVFYPDENADAIRDALAAYYGVSRSNIFVGNGSDEVLAAVLSYLRQRYGDFCTWKTGYAIYPILAKRFKYKLHFLNNVDPCEFPLSDNSLYVLDSPNAITGERSSCDFFIALMRSSDSFLVWDNCYGEFCGDVPFSSPVPKNMVFVRTFSKFFGLAGLRIGYCIADDTVVSSLMALKDIFNVNAVAQQAALAALARRHDFVQCANEIVTYRNRLVEFLRRLAFTVREPNGNFVFASHPSISAEYIVNALRERRIQVRWYNQSPVTANWIRVTVPPPSQFARFTEAVEESILRYVFIAHDRSAAGSQVTVPRRLDPE